MFWRNETQPCFVFARWLAMATVGATLLLLIIAVVRQSLNEIGFAIVVLFVIPIFAATGYGFCKFAHSSLIALREDERPLDFFPSNWPLPFPLINRMYRLLNHSAVGRLELLFMLAFLNCFVILWNGFLLLCVVLTIVDMTMGDILQPILIQQMQ